MEKYSFYHILVNGQSCSQSRQEYVGLQESDQNRKRPLSIHWTLVRFTRWSLVEGTYRLSEVVGSQSSSMSVHTSVFNRKRLKTIFRMDQIIISIYEMIHDYTYILINMIIIKFILVFLMSLLSSYSQHWTYSYLCYHY